MEEKQRISEEWISWLPPMKRALSSKEARATPPTII